MDTRGYVEHRKGIVTVKFSYGYINGSADCWTVRDNDTGTFWRFPHSEDEALACARRLASGRPIYQHKGSAWVEVSW